MTDNQFTIQLIGTVEDLYGDNVDVFVYFPYKNEKFVSTFYTPANIVKLMEKNRAQNENKNGLYFCDRSWMIIRNLAEELICEAINDLLETGMFKYVFEGPYSIQSEESD